MPISPKLARSIFADLTDGSAVPLDPDDLTIKTVSRPKDAKGFVVLPRRWVGTHASTPRR